MITSEVRKWLKKVETKQYSYEDTMSEFVRFTSYLTREELKFIKSKIEEIYK